MSLDVQWHLILGREDEHGQDVSVSGVAAVPVLPENKEPSVRVRYFIQLYTEKKIKFSSYIRKFKVEQLQSHI
jgi:hypothetical protein